MSAQSSTGTRTGPAAAKRALVARREGLAKRYRHLIGVPEREASPEDDVDRASELEVESFRSHLSEQEDRELEEIDEALARIDRGEFGLCEQCHGKIAAARLRAVPEARLCIRCSGTERR